ncbi:MAG TPA: DNA replication and repair protein RecF [Chromatiaceae bacterium]|nr:DNA replication and repair protein RecF [Chromatiaceae bacterium]
MMRIESLFIKDLRVIQALEFEPVRGVNVITGNNGAGKTSILEAIFLLGNGRTFRHQEAGSLVRNGTASAIIGSRLVFSSGRKSSLGIKRASKGFTARQDGKRIKRRSDLVRALPLQLLFPASHELIEKGPELRRRFLDQGLFHVEQSYHQLSLEYAKALKQRNAALRIGDLSLARSFSSQLASSGEGLSLLRKQFVEEIEQELLRILPRFNFNRDVKLGIRKGWRGEKLLDALHRNEKTDLKMGFTTTGCHRAELTLTLEGALASRVLSRGEQKLLVYALTFAQLNRLIDQGDEPPILLIDDFAAEFDAERMELIKEYLVELPVQIFLTNISADPFKSEQPGVFHVEQGRMATRKEVYLEKSRWSDRDKDAPSFSITKSD